MPQCRFDGGQDHIQPDVDEVNSCQRDDEISSDNDSLVQHVIENIDQRDLVVAAGIRKSQCARRAHDDWESRETKEYGGHGPVHSMLRAAAHFLENFFRTDCNCWRLLRFTNNVV